MTLLDGNTEKAYYIAGIYVEEDITRRLEALGFNEGTMIYISAKKRSGTMIVKIRGTRLALGKHISSLIEIQEGLAK